MARLLPSTGCFAWAAVLMLSANARGAIQLVQHASHSTGQSCGGGYAGSPGPYSVAFPAANAAGDAIIVYAFWAWGGTLTAQVSDSQGNAYVAVPVAASTTSPASQQSVGQIFYASNIRPGSNTVTLTLDPCYDWPAGLAILEYSGFSPGITLDVSASQVAPPSTSSASTPTVTTSAPNELLIGAFTDVAGTGGIVPGNGWTSEVPVKCFYSLVEDQNVSVIGPYAATAMLPTTDNQWIGTIAAFRSGPSDAGVPDGGQDGGRGSPLLVQASENYQRNAASVALGFHAPTAAGNHIVVLGYWGAPGAATGGAVFDSQGDLFAATPLTLNAAAGSVAQIFYAEAIDGGPDTVTLFQPNDAGRVGMAIFEYAGLVSANALDAHSGQAAPDAGFLAVTPPTAIADPNELLFSGFIHPDPDGPYAGAGLIDPGAGWGPTSCSVSSYLLVEDRIAAGVGSYAATAQMPVADNAWTAVMATFRIAQPPDAGHSDAGASDAGTTDSGSADASLEDAGNRSPFHETIGCDCEQASAAHQCALACLVALLLARARSRRRPDP